MTADPYTRAHVASTLETLLSQYGRDLAEDPRRLAALLADYAPGARGSSVAIVIAAEEGIPAREIAVGRVDALNFGQLVSTLTSQRAMSTEAAVWAVRAWATALGIEADVPQALAAAAADSVSFTESAAAPPSTYVAAPPADAPSPSLPVAPAVPAPAPVADDRMLAPDPGSGSGAIMGIIVGLVAVVAVIVIVVAWSAIASLNSSKSSTTTSSPAPSTSPQTPAQTATQEDAAPQDASTAQSTGEPVLNLTAPYQQLPQEQATLRKAILDAIRVNRGMSANQLFGVAQLYAANGWALADVAPYQGEANGSPVYGTRIMVIVRGAPWEVVGVDDYANSDQSTVTGQQSGIDQGVLGAFQWGIPFKP